MISALYVETGGHYFGLEGVDPWDAERDARLYAGPHPVVAHPPCSTWCQLASVNEVRYGRKIGDDGGCFEAALEAVRTWGGVLEHPAYSLAWPRFCLPAPSAEGWQRAFCGGFVARVDQSHYGHRAKKSTWLYAFGIDPQPLNWDRPPESTVWIGADRPRAELAERGIGLMSKKEARTTPIAFRDTLLSIARTVG